MLQQYESLEFYCPSQNTCSGFGLEETPTGHTLTLVSSMGINMTRIKFPKNNLENKKATKVILRYLCGYDISDR
jgi:hypothetical protein